MKQESKKLTNEMNRTFKKSKGIICILDKCHQEPFQPLHHRYSRQPVVVALALDQRWPMVEVWLWQSLDKLILFITGLTFLHFIA